jgi:DNA-binding GntR family transcriptional regulator
MHDARQIVGSILEERIVRGELQQGRRLDERALAAELHADPGVVREALVCLERDNLTRAEEDGSFSVTPLDEVELRELYPVVLLLEGMAVRSAPAFPPEQLAELRAINQSMRAGAGDAMEAATCDWRFHDALVRGCGNDQLLETLRPLKRQLLRYEFAYMADSASVETSVAQHDEIVDALERDDREEAAALVEANWRHSLPGLLERLARR